MKIAHLSDIHYCADNLDEVERCMAFAIERIEAEAADAIVVSGDIMDRRLDLHAPSVEAMVGRVRALADIAPVLILQGTFSHDAPGAIHVFRHLRAAYPVAVVDRISQLAWDGGRWEQSEGWSFEARPPGTQLLLSCLPSVNKAAVVAASGSAEEAGRQAGDAVADLMRGWSRSHIEAREAGIAPVVVSHGTVSGCVTEHGVPMAGLDHEFSIGALFASEASAVMLGHIHRHQSWGSDDCRLIAYAGSLGRYHYGEEGDKGFLMWEVNAAGADFELIVTPARRTVEVTLDRPPTPDDIDRIGRDAQGAYVRVRYSVDEEHRDSVDRRAIEATLSQAGALAIKIEPRINPIQRTRAPGMAAATSLHERLRQWCEVTETEPDPVLERLGALEETPDADTLARTHASL